MRQNHIVFRYPRLISGSFFLLLASLGLTLAPAAAARAQSSSSSSSSSSSYTSAQPESALPPTVPANDSSSNTPTARPRAALMEPGGAAITLETSEPLFDLASALNACGYDDDLDISAPVRGEVRADMNAALAFSEQARDARDAMCTYIRSHQLSDEALNIGQYVSLALYLSPPPELTPNVSELQLPPQANAVVNVLPLVRRFASAVDLHYIWIKHRPEYEAWVARIHDPMTRMILNTNVFLRLPISSYDGRRFLVLLEPMLSPNLTNARIYGVDYIIVTSPSNSTTTLPVRMDQLRHIYLHYLVEPMVYSRGAAMERLQPILRGVQDAPIEFVFKSDIVAFITECLIKSIEAHLYVLPQPPPPQPKPNASRSTQAIYADAMDAYNRQTSIERDRLVSLDEAHGWTLTGYFYEGITVMLHNGDSLNDEIAPMIYGIDPDTARRHAEQIVFTTGGTEIDPLRPQQQPRPPSKLELAELDLGKGDLDGASTLAHEVLADPKGDRGRAFYVLARIDLMHGQPQKAMEGFDLVLKNTQDPRTLAWSHIYLGRLYDIMDPPDRTQALAEYQAALDNRDSLPDTKAAAEAGLKAPFALPHSAPPADDANSQNFDPTGKAEKQAYKPSPQ